MDGAAGGDASDVALNLSEMTSFDALLATTAVGSTSIPEVPPKDNAPNSSNVRRLRKCSPTKVVDHRRQIPAEASTPSEDASSSPRGRSPTRRSTKRKHQQSELLFRNYSVFFLLHMSCVAGV